MVLKSTHTPVVETESLVLAAGALPYQLHLGDRRKTPSTVENTARHGDDVTVVVEHSGALDFPHSEHRVEGPRFR